MGWMVWGSKPTGGEIFCIIHNGPGAHTAFYAMGTGSLPGVKRSGHGIDHPRPYSSKLKKRERGRESRTKPLLPLCASWHVMDNFTFFTRQL